MALRVNTRAAREVASLLSQFKDVTPMCDYNDASHSGVQSGGALLPMRQHGSIPPNPTPLARLESGALPSLASGCALLPRPGEPP